MLFFTSITLADDENSLGFIFFNEIPPAGLWLGAALILGASTYIGVRQVKKKKEELNTNTNISI